MPTLPHRARDVAESFGADAERYDRARPSYPEALTDELAASFPGPDVLDVGIGTGISARPFAAAGCTVMGVEADARMAALARARGFAVEVARFEDWDPAGRTFDAVVSGQTWHWVDPAAGAAKAARVLRPGGRLALFWNVQQPPGELASAFAEVYGRVVPGTPFAAAPRDALDTYEQILAAATGGIRATGAFDDPARLRLDWTTTYTTAQWLEQVPTFGGHSTLPPSQVAEILAGIGAAIDAVGGRFEMRYATVAIAAGRGGWSESRGGGPVTGSSSPA